MRGALEILAVLACVAAVAWLAADPWALDPAGRIEASVRREVQRPVEAGELVEWGEWREREREEER